jgi:hypothetical protein
MRGNKGKNSAARNRFVATVLNSAVSRKLSEGGTENLLEITKTLAELKKMKIVFIYNNF